MTEAFTVSSTENLSSSDEKDVYLEFSGYIKLDSSTKLQYTGESLEVPQIITVKEWLALSQSMRYEYILENFQDAIRDGKDLEFEDLDLCDE
jgi:hypothetical protein